MIKLWNKTPRYDASYGQSEPSLTPFLLDGKDNLCVIVCPGGAYTFKAEPEGRPIAEWLNTCGFSAFVLDYRVAPYRAPVPLLDLQRAIRLVRKNAAEYGINPQKLGVLGFSAGAHLCACASVLYNEKIEEADADDPISARPDFAVLCYPPTDMKDTVMFNGAEENLLGHPATEDEKLHYSIPYHVNGDTPPIFMWHTSDDDCVTVDNSLYLSQALYKAGVKFELHIFPTGRHGLDLAKDDPVVSQWTTLCANWLGNL